MVKKRDAKRILVVEDSKDMRDIYKSYFHAHADEFDVDIQADATKALERLKSSAYDLIVTDIIMEPMTGESFLVYARDNTSSKGLPIVVVSVLSDSVLRGLSRFDNVHFLQKPITEEQLIGTIRRHLN